MAPSAGVETPAPYRRMVFLWTFSGFIVLMEPAPYDGLFLVILGMALAKSCLAVPLEMLSPLALLSLFVAANLISLPLAEANGTEAMRYFLITLYLTLTWVLLIGLSCRFGDGIVDAALSGYLIAGVTAALTGILGYLHLLPGSQLVMRVSGRITGYFKDPNVFGPFLVPPSILCLQKCEGAQKTHRAAMWMGVYLVMAAGILLSFSRAAWINLAVSTVAYLAQLWGGVLSRRGRLIGMIAAVGVPGAILLLSLPQVRTMFWIRWGLQRYDADRFGTFRMALSHSVEMPIGIGPGQAEVTFGMSTHNLFIRTISECGLLGICSLMGFIAITLWRSLIVSIRRRARPSSAGVILASLLGALVNSTVIDTLHWRHLWLLMALPWCLNSEGITREEGMHL